MKILITLLSFVFCIALNAQYKYGGESITAAQFESLYKQAGQNIYTYQNKFYDMTDMKTGKSKNLVQHEKIGMAKFDLKKITSKENGTAEGNVSYLQETYQPAKMGAIQSSTTSSQPLTVTVSANISGLSAADLTKNSAQIPVMVITEKPFTMARLKPASKEDFKKYLAENNLVYGIKEKTIPGETKPCPDCNGKGRISKPGKSKHNERNVIITTTCTKCDGSGTIESKAAKTEITVVKILKSDLE